MEIGDFEPTNEFEFDLSDVDVAAFESVATEVTVTAAQDNQNQNLSEPNQQQEQSQTSLEPPLHPQSPILNRVPTLTQPRQPLPSDQPQHHVTLTSTTENPATGKILLVPINSKTGTPGLKQIFQLPPGSPITMGTLTTLGNKKQMIQLTPLSASSLTLTKNNYQFPVTTTQLMPASSHGLKQPQQLYITHASSSPMKPQQATLGPMLNKSLDNVTNNGPVTSHLSSANLSTRTVSFNDSLRTPTPAPILANDVPKRKPCNCTKSQCLKLYCDCFANGEFCSGCNCTNCFNSLTKEKERQQAITQCLERNPEAFRPKIGKAVKQSLGEPAPDSIERRHTKGCNCKRSGCLKNYCECYEAKILCSNLCKCCGCKNYEESFERKSLIQLTNSAPDNTRGILKNLLPTNSGSYVCKDFTKCFITDQVIQASLICLLKSAQQAEEDCIPENKIPNLLQTEMGRCLRMIVNSTPQSSSPKKR